MPSQQSVLNFPQTRNRSGSRCKGIVASPRQLCTTATTVTTPTRRSARQSKPTEKLTTNAVILVDVNVEEEIVKRKTPAKRKG